MPMTKIPIYIYMESNKRAANKYISAHSSLTSTIELVEEQIAEYIGEVESAVYIVIPPDGGWGWVIVTAAFLSFMISDGMLYTFGIFINDMAEDFNCTKGKVVLISAITSSLFSLSGPFIAALINKFGYRPIAILGSLIAGISFFVSSEASNLQIIYLTTGVLGGTGFGMIFLPSVIAVGFYFEKWRALATSIAMCGTGIGGMTLPLLLGIVIDKNGWRYTYKVTGILILISILCGLSLKPLKPTKIQDGAEASNNLSVIMEESTSLCNQSRRTTHPTIQEIRSRTRPWYKRSNLRDDQSRFTTSTAVGNKSRVDDDTISEYILEGTSYDVNSTIISINTSTNEEEIKNKSCCSCLVKIPICRCLCAQRKKRDQPEEHPLETIARPMYRDDIFYGASLLYLPEYQKYKTASTHLTKSTSTAGYSMAVTRAITRRELAESKRYSLCSESLKRTLTTMLDFKLLKSPSFVLFTMNSMFISMGCYVPYMFIQDRSIENGVSKKIAFWFLPCISIANTIGRIACGVIGSFPKISKVQTMYLNSFLGGLATLVSELSFDLWVQFLYAAIYGFTLAPSSVLRTIVVVDLIGLENLTNAIGLSLMFQGLASLIGVFVSGLLKDISDSYQLSFYFAGGCHLIGSLLLVPIKKVAEWERLRTEANN